MKMPDRVHEARLDVLALVLLEERQVIVDLARNDIEEQAFRLARLVVHEQTEAIRSAVREPLVDCQTVPLRLGNLLSLFIEEQFIVESLGRQSAECPGDLPGELYAVDKILACHLVIDTKRHPTHGPVGLPLQLCVTTGYRSLEPLACVGIAPHDGPSFDI